MSSASDRSERRLDALFVVSNLGQARSVAAVLAEDGVARSALVATLATPRNLELPAKIQQFLQRSGIESVTVLLPDLPTHPRIATVRQVTEAYEDLAARWPTDALWISNFNAHYGVLASIFAAAGSRICYLEEGLGSYRTLDDPIFERADPTTARSQFAAAVRRAVRQRLGWSIVYRWPVAIRRFLRSCRQLGVDVAAHAGTFRSSRSGYSERLEHRVSPHGARFLEPWTRFDEVRVVFPSLLDPQIFDLDRTKPIELRPPAAEVDRAAAVLRTLDAQCVDVDTLYVSQPYGNRTRDYYEMVAQVISEHVGDRVFVKFHPRERLQQRGYLMEALDRRGVEAVEAAAAEQFNAEALLATGRFERCLGITSSTLLYGERYYPSVEFVALGHELIAEIEASGPAGDQWQQLLSDVALLDDVVARVASGD
jgi:Alpha-2,8-polysialyltransferase (POLYST)